MIRTLTIMTWLLGIGAIGGAMAQQAAPVQAHPRLLLDREGVEGLREKVKHEPWKSTWKRMLDHLDREVGRPTELPPRGGNWYHNYVCPTHGVRLSQEESTGKWSWTHRCAVGPHEPKSDPADAKLDFDGCGIAGVHDRNSELIRDLGVAFALTGESRYADHARAILLAYAQRYLSYPRHDNQNKPVQGSGGGRVASQSLSEATWLVDLTQGADLIWDTLSPQEKKQVETQLLRPALDETIRNPSSKPVVHNIQCHRNTAIGLVGFLLGDQALVDEAIDGKHGYRVNMRDGVQADGVWFEGSWGYHFYTLSALWPLCEAARHAGINLYGPELKRMYDAPLKLATPDLRLPAFNDSSEVNLKSQGESYELAYARYEDPAYLAILKSGSRTGQHAFWYGATDLPEASAAAAPGSFNAPASGYAVLRRGDGPDATWVCVKYGPHGGGHGHPDKNNAVLFARQHWVMSDPGTRPYGSPLHAGWDKTTLAHNTLVIDGQNQKQATGSCLAFGSQDGIDYVMTDAGPIADGLRFVRSTVLLDPGLVLFIDQVTAQRPHTLELACHLEGQWQELPAGASVTLPDKPPYALLRDAAARKVPSEGLSLRSRVGSDLSARLIVAGNIPAQLITATGVGRSTEDRVPVAFLHRQVQDTVFVWAVCLDEEPVQLAVASGRAAPTSVTVTHGERTWRVTADSVAGRVEVR